MGCLVGLLVVAVGLAGAFFAAEYISLWLAVVFLAVIVLGPGLYLNRYGHRQFGGGGNTDLFLYLMIVGVSLAIAIPRYNRDRACGALAEYADWFEAVQNAHYDQFGRFADRGGELTRLPLETAPPSSNGIRISAEPPDERSFGATLTHESCPEAVNIQIQRETSPPLSEAPDTASGGGP